MAVVRVGEAANPGPGGAHCFDDPDAGADQSESEGGLWAVGPPSPALPGAGAAMGLALDPEVGFARAPKFAGGMPGWVYRR
eukprot:3726170-Alexandrium_andersonii.AAC.1